MTDAKASRAFADAAQKAIDDDRRSELCVERLLAAFVPPEFHIIARQIFRLKAKYSPYQLAVADAREWIIQHSGEFADDDEAARIAAKRFGVREDSVFRAAFDRNWQTINEILEEREQLNHSV